MAAAAADVARIEAEAAAKVSQAQADLATARAETMQVRAELAAELVHIEERVTSGFAGGVA